MQRFTYGDTVKIHLHAPSKFRPGEPATVVGISLETERRGDFLALFPQGVVYTIEFEGGDFVEIHESLVEKGAFPSELS
jgi:hypothetical protein